jgi:hypothetical protein
MSVGTYYLKEYYGTVPVDENGSAFFEAPSNVELYFTAVDEDGKEIQRMGSVTQITTGETVSCIGCHEGRLKTPQPDGIFMARLGRRPDKITPPAWGAGPIDYAEHIQPVWDRHCVECHDGTEPTGGVDMTGDKTRFFNMSFDSLCMRDRPGGKPVYDYTYVRYYTLLQGPTGVFPAMQSGSRVSKLTKMLEAGHPASDTASTVKLSRDELERIYVWIDANIPYYPTWDMSRPYSTGGRDLFTIPRKPKAQEWTKVVTVFLARHRQQMTSASINFTRPEFSRILMRNLAKSAGGWAENRKAIFNDRNDPEYRTVLEALERAAESVRKYPRMDMPGAVAIPQKRDFGKAY